jgi:predicted component of type VI protein secretion system
MKKIVVIILMAFTLGLIMSSCQSSQKCAAYGETSKYKIDRNR